MDNQINYIRVSAENVDACKLFSLLLHEYIQEMNKHSERPLPEQFVQKWCNSILSMQGPSDRHLELCYADKVPIGFLYGKVDHKDHAGFVKPGYGYIMEFYVRPEHRRMGFGKMMFLHLERLFRIDGAEMMYLTADPVTGKPFWEAIGFVNTKEMSPENKLYIYEKPAAPAFEYGVLKSLTEATAVEIGQWEYEKPYDVYNFKGFPDDWLMDRSTWGTEQFCLMDGDVVLGQVACQLEGNDLWVGWSMAPELVGKGNGSAFVWRCVQELKAFTGHKGRILLRVAAWNQRAIRAYQKAGFVYVETIQDEIAYSGNMEDFWVMAFTE